jgi:hypothetical protein
MGRTLCKLDNCIKGIYTIYASKTLKYLVVERKQEQNGILKQKTYGPARTKSLNYDAKTISVNIG